MDTFHDALEGLVLAEVDLGENGDEPSGLSIGPCIEVTVDQRFTGGALAVISLYGLPALLAECGLTETG